MDGGVMQVKASTVRALLKAHNEPVDEFIRNVKRGGAQFLPQGCILYAKKKGCCFLYSIGYYGFAGADIVRLAKNVPELKEEMLASGWKI